MSVARLVRGCHTAYALHIMWNIDFGLRLRLANETSELSKNQM